MIKSSQQLVSFCVGYSTSWLITKFLGYKKILFVTSAIGLLSLGITVAVDFEALYRNG